MSATLSTQESKELANVAVGLKNSRKNTIVNSKIFGFRSKLKKVSGLSLAFFGMGSEKCQI